MNTPDAGNQLYKKLNARTLVVIAALALPVVLLATVVHYGKPEQAPPPAPQAARAPAPQPSLEQQRAYFAKRVDHLRRITPAQWAEEKKNGIWGAPTQKDALNWNTMRLAQLDAMIKQQHMAQSRLKPAAAPAAQHPAATQPKTKKKPTSSGTAR